MTARKAGSTAAPHLIVRALVVSVAAVMEAAVAVVVVGGFAPQLPTIGRFGLWLDADLPWIAALAVIPLALALIALLLGGGRFTKLLAVVSLASLVGTGVVAATYTVYAASHRLAFSLERQASEPAGTRGPDARVTYATVDGEELSVEIWQALAGAPNDGPNGRTAVLYLHGGGFVAGAPGSRPNLFQTLADAGYPVIDVEYRLAPPPRWRDAPADALCALAWLAAEAPGLGIDPARVVVMGDSAGGSLALVAGYGAGLAGATGLLRSPSAIEPSCDGIPLLPAGIVGFAPAADLEGIWTDLTEAGVDRPFPEDYVGGTPAQFPERYAAASPFDLLRPGLPRTLLITGYNDHMVRIARVEGLVDRLRAGGVDVTLVVVPFADHGFDGQANGFGAQLGEGLVLRFLGEVGR